MYWIKSKKDKLVLRGKQHIQLKTCNNGQVAKQSCEMQCYNFAIQNV